MHCEHGIEFTTKEIDLSSRDEVKRWIRSNQLARRNLTKEQRNYLIGLEYKERKQQGKRTDLTSPQNEEKLTTAERIGKKQKVSHATVERAEKFAEAIDVIARNVGDEAKEKILAREIIATDRDIKDLSKEDADTQRTE